MPSIMDMPAELGIMIAENVGTIKDLAALARTCRKYHDITEPVLYKRALISWRWGDRLLFWAIEFDRPQTLAKALSTGFSPYETQSVECDSNEWRRLMRKGKLQSRQRIDARTQCAEPLLVQNVNPTYDATVDVEDLQVTRYPDGRPRPQVTHNDLAGLEDRYPNLWYTEENREYPWRRGSASTFTRNMSYTPLHLAAQKGRAEMIDLLLQHDADIDEASDYCCGCTSPMSLTETLENASPRPESPTPAHDEYCYPWTALHLAICHGQHESAKHLIDAGAEVTDPYLREDEMPLFHLAAATGQADTLELMIAEIQSNYVVVPDRPFHAFINQRDGNGLTPLYHAMANSRWDTTVPLLLRHEACPGLEVEYTLDPNHILDTTTGRPSQQSHMVKISLLAEFCRLGRFEDASKLLSILGKSAASRLAQIQIITAPNVNEAPAESTNPTTTSRSIPLLHICCMQPLRNYDQIFLPMRDFPLEETRERWRSVFIKQLVATLGLNINSPWRVGEDPDSTPLMVAARHGCLTAINTLLDLGADPRVKNSEGRNVMMLAMIQRAREDHCKIRLPSDGNGLDVFCPEFKEIPPLTSSMTRIPLLELTCILERFISSGIPIDEQDREGMTVLHFFFQGSPLQRFVPLHNRKLDCRPLKLSPAEQRLLNFLVGQGADPTINAGVRDRSVLWTTFAGPWSNACGTLLGSRFGPDIIRFFNNNPDQLRDMFLHTVQQYAHEPRSFYEWKDSLESALGRLLDLDHQRRLVSDTWLLSQILDVEQDSKSLHRLTTTCLAERRIGADRFDFQTSSEAIRLFERITSACAWHLASRLISQVPVDSQEVMVAVISCLARTSDSATSRAECSSATSGTGLWHFITRVVDAGFDVHWRPPAGTIEVKDEGLASAGYGTKSLLSWAIWTRWAPLVEFMLNKQPIRGNLAAAQCTYLHELFSEPVLFKEYDRKYSSRADHDFLQHAYRPKSLRYDAQICNRMVQALLGSGADPTVKDSDGRYPIDVLQKGLPKRKRCVKHYSIWFERLMRHLDGDEAVRKGVSAKLLNALAEDDTESDSEPEEGSDAYDAFAYDAFAYDAVEYW